MQFIDIQKANNKYMKDYDKNKEPSYLKYWDVNNLYGSAILQKLPVNKLGWIEDTFQFNEDFLKNFNEEGDEGYFLVVDVQYPEKLYELHNDLPFLPERMKREKPKSKKIKYLSCFYLTILFCCSKKHFRNSTHYYLM